MTPSPEAAEAAPPATPAAPIPTEDVLSAFARGALSPAEAEAALEADGYSHFAAQALLANIPGALDVIERSSDSPQAAGAGRETNGDDTSAPQTHPAPMDPAVLHRELATLAQNLADAVGAYGGAKGTWDDVVLAAIALDDHLDNHDPRRES